MKKLLLAPLGLLAVSDSFSQDSTAAVYINDYIDQIESRLANDILEKKDTIIFTDDSSKAFPLRVQTQFYTEPQTMQVEKIVEKSVYKNLTTEITVYFRFNQAIRFTSLQKEGNIVKNDFDVYYVNNNSIHFTKRTENKGKPDGDEFLAWCKDLLKEYDEMVKLQKETEPKPVSKPNKSIYIFGKKKKKSG